MPTSLKKQNHEPRMLSERGMNGECIDRSLQSEIRPATAAKLKTARKKRSVSVNIGESPLSWLFAHGHLDERQFLAGEKLRNDYERAAMGANITMSWDPAPPTKSRRSAPRHLDASENMLNAKKRFDNALAVLGEGLDNVAWRVICSGESVSSAEKSLGWPTRSGKLVLKLALDRLAHHYHIR